MMTPLIKNGSSERQLETVSSCPFDYEHFHNGKIVHLQVKQPWKMIFQARHPMNLYLSDIFTSNDLNRPDLATGNVKLIISFEMSSISLRVVQTQVILLLKSVPERSGSDTERLWIQMTFSDRSIIRFSFRIDIWRK